jgi:hypothetical protein
MYPSSNKQVLLIALSFIFCWSRGMMPSVGFDLEASQIQSDFLHTSHAFACG